MNTYSYSLRAFSAAALMVLPLSMSAQSVLVDFDSSDSFDMLNKGVSDDGHSGLGDLTWSEDTGLGGTDSAYRPNASTDSFTYSTVTAFDGGFTSSTMSTYVKISDVTIAGGALALTMGFNSLATVDTGSGSAVGVPTLTPTTGGATGSQYSFSVNLRSASSSNVAGVDGVSDNYAFGSYNNASHVSNGGSVALTIGNWYYWETNITHAGDNYSINAQLFASDAAGTISGTALLDYDISFDNASLSDESDIYGYISSQNGSRRGIERIDNLSFSAIPEPSSFAGVFGLAVFLFVGCRRPRG